MLTHRRDALELKAELVRRLRSAAGHLHGIAAMIERGENCQSILSQLVAVRGALREVSRLLLRQHLDTCLRQLWQDTGNDITARDKYLDEIVSLYQLLGTSAPLK